MISSLRRLLDTGNVVRFLLSFICAFALWAWVTADRDPEQTYRANQVPVVVENTPAGLELVGLPQAVDLTLQGPRSVIQTIDAGSIRAYIDLSSVPGPGSYEFRVRVDAPSGIRRISVQPEVVRVEVDTVVSRTFTIDVLHPDEVPRSVAITNTLVNPSEVVVTGVQQNVDRVARVILPVELRGQTESFTVEARPQAVDANNVEVPSVEVRPNSVTVNVTLEVRGKEIPVFVRCECTALDGYEVIGQPIASPSTILIDGPREALAQVQYIYTTPIDTSGLSEPSLLSDVPLDTTALPEGVTVERLLVEVSVRVEQSLFTRVFENVPVDILGATPDIEVSVTPGFVSIEIEGPREDIAALTPDDVAVIVDIDGLDVGTHQLRPRVILPPRTRYSEPPPQVVVAITAVPPTPTPTVPPTATPAPTPSPTPTTFMTPEP
ncbi:MAG TPA: CdaR family protein [Thermomicrobiales bacterium]|nr:CdaR family protein [Thermomicrobiales bacterium]